MQNINFIGSSQEDTRISNYFKQMGILKAENAKLLQENKAMKALIKPQMEEIKSLKDDTVKKYKSLEHLSKMYQEQTDLITELRKENRINIDFIGASQEEIEKAEKYERYMSEKRKEAYTATYNLHFSGASREEIEKAEKYEELMCEKYEKAFYISNTMNYIKIFKDSLNRAIDNEKYNSDMYFEEVNRGFVLAKHNRNVISQLKNELKLKNKKIKSLVRFSH